MMEFKEVLVGSKVVAMVTEGEFDAFEAIVVKPGTTRKSAQVIRLEHADQAMKEHGAGWMGVVLADEEGTDVMRLSLEQLFKPTPDVNKFIVEFKTLADQRTELTKKMEQLANRYSFHVAGKEHEKKIKKDAKEPVVAKK